MIKIFISAIEPSGDVLGAELMRAMRTLNPKIQFFGLGGPLMAQEGLTSLFPIQDLTLMGFLEVLPKLGMIFKRIRQTVEYISDLQPDAVLTIDGLGFHKRVIKKIQSMRSRIPFIQYVAPAVWAWKPGRAKKMAALIDKLLVIFPFEPPYFEAHGLSTVFIGHPVTERFPLKSVSFYKDDHTQIVLLPGSRIQEVKRHLPVFLKAAEKIAKVIPSCRFILPTMENLMPIMENDLKDSPLPIHIITDAEEKYRSFQESHFAIAASGTVSLELAMAQLPAVIAYKTSPLTYAIAKRLARVPYICMVNILINRAVVPELIQHDCTPEHIAERSLKILQSECEFNKFQEGYKEAIHKLSAPDHKNPSVYAAKIIYNCLKINTP